MWYLIQPQLHKSKHGDGHGHGEHDEHSEDSEEHKEDEGGKSDEGVSAEEVKADQSKEVGEGESASDGGDMSESSNEDGQDTPETSDDEDPGNTAHEKEGGGNVEGVQFKGATSGGTEEGEQGDTRKHIPDSKGFNKKRIESHYGKQLGEAQESEQDPEGKDLVSLDYFESYVKADNCRRGHRQSQQAAWTHNLGSKRASPTQAPSTPQILPMIQTRVRKAKGCRRQPKRRELSIQIDHRNKKRVSIPLRMHGGFAESTRYGRGLSARV